MNIIDKRRMCFLWFPLRFTTYELVNRNNEFELVITSGLLSKHINRIKLYRINDLTYDRSLGNWLFGVGNIIVSSTDPSNHSSHIRIEKIREAKDFLDTLERFVRKERQRMNVGYQETNIIK